MNSVDLKDETKYPCYTCIHNRVCNAKSCFAETEVKTTHPYIVVKLECAEYRKNIPTPKTPRFLENECTNPNQ